jgi:hypothetical protein
MAHVTPPSAYWEYREGVPQLVIPDFPPHDAPTPMPSPLDPTSPPAVPTPNPVMAQAIRRAMQNRAGESSLDRDVPVFGSFGDWMDAMRTPGSQGVTQGDIADWGSAERAAYATGKGPRLGQGDVMGPLDNVPTNTSGIGSFLANLALGPFGYNQQYSEDPHDRRESVSRRWEPLRPAADVLGTAVGGPVIGAAANRLVKGWGPSYDMGSGFTGEGSPGTTLQSPLEESVRGRESLLMGGVPADSTALEPEFSPLASQPPPPSVAPAVVPVMRQPLPPITAFDHNLRTFIEGLPEVRNPEFVDQGPLGVLAQSVRSPSIRASTGGGGSNGRSDALAQGIADALNGQFATGGGQGGLGREMGDWGSEDLGNWGGLGGRW